MYTTLSSKWHLPVLFSVFILLAGCGVATKKTFLDEPVQENAGNAVPVSNKASGSSDSSELSQNPAIRSAEATGVQKLLNIITPYRINIQQGNFVSQEMLGRVQPGMTKEQVRFALGTPLLTDAFHAGRWDYIFRLQKPNGQITNNRVIIHFENDRVARIANDPLPNETQYLETVSSTPLKKKEKDDESTPEETVTQEESSAESAETTAEPVAAPTTETTSSQSVEEQPVVDESRHLSSENETDVLTTPDTSRQEETAIRYSDQEEETVPQEPHVTQPAISAPSSSIDESESESLHQSYTAPTPTEQETVTPEVRSYQADPVEPVSEETAPATEATAETDSYQDTAPSSDSERTTVDTPYTQQPATTIQDTSSEPEDDFKAAPNSTMQLHQLMQPQ